VVHDGAVIVLQSRRINKYNTLFPKGQMSVVKDRHVISASILSATITPYSHETLKAAVRYAKVYLCL